MPSAEYDIRYLKAALEALEDYLKHQGLFWPIGVSPPAGEPPYPRLTIGNVLLAMQRLQRPLPDPERAEVLQLIENIRQIAYRYRTLWEKKLQREARMRARLWGEYLQNPDAGHYPYEVRHRVILELMMQNLSPPPADIAQLLHGLDQRLRRQWQQGSFVWDEPLQPAFPQQPFWYLYGQLRGSF